MISEDVLTSRDIRFDILQYVVFLSLLPILFLTMGVDTKLYFA